MTFFHCKTTAAQRKPTAVIFATALCLLFLCALLYGCAAPAPTNPPLFLEDGTSKAPTTATGEPTVGTDPTETESTVTEPQEDAGDPQKDSGGHMSGQVGADSDIADLPTPGAAAQLSYGIDVSKYQGTIDWKQAAQAGVDFVMVRIGYRDAATGRIVEDANARYNLQEASRHGILLGAYFFSTAVNTQEAREEAAWTADILDQYPISFPVAYNCEGFEHSGSRQKDMTKSQRTDAAIAFLEAIGQRGYEPMFYAAKYELEGDAKWEASRIAPRWKIWVAQYPALPYPQTPSSDYSGTHAMWQYTNNGTVPGISQPVDMNIAYFGYTEPEPPKNDTPPETVKPDPEALMTFTEVSEQVTAKIEVNLRDIPSQGDDSTVVCRLANGQIAVRTGISSSGWSRLEYNGQVLYAVSSYLTTDLTSAPTDTPEPGMAFSPVQEEVTAKIEVNLRSSPDQGDDSNVVCKLANGQIAVRTGISSSGWSRLEYNGQVLYAVSSYLTTQLDYTPPVQINTPFTAVSEQVTAKDVVNLRTLPSVTDPNSQVVAQLENGQIALRTGINTDVGWSRIEYNGQVLYCISSYLMLWEEVGE